MSISRRTILSGIAASGLLAPVVASAAGADPAPAKAPAAAQKEKKILFVLTSCNKIPETGNPTGYFYSEVSHPWKVLTDAGYEIDLSLQKAPNQQQKVLIRRIPSIWNLRIMHSIKPN